MNGGKSSVLGLAAGVERTKSLWINAELHRELKMRAAETRRSIRDLAEVAIRLYLDGGPKNPVGK